MKIDIKGILEGIGNLVVAKRWVEEVSADRMYICRKCELSSDLKEGYTSSRPDFHCTECGCNLELKTRCMSCSCPLNKWTNVMGEDDWEQLKSKLK